MLRVGVVGWALRKLGFDMAPIILDFVLRINPHQPGTEPGLPRAIGGRNPGSVPGWSGLR
jgi:hypothetical protein